MTDRAPRFEDAHHQRLAAWRRDSHALRQGPGLPAGTLALPDEATLVQRFSASQRRAALLPHPSLLPREHEREHAHHQHLMRRSFMFMAGGAALSLAGVLVPSLARWALWMLGLGCFVAAAMAARSARLIEARAFVMMKGPLAEAWFAWNDATARINALDGAAVAREALGANEARMSELVLELARAEQSGARTPTHDAARAWVLAAAAKAAVLADAAAAAEHDVRNQIEAHGLDLAPDGDLEALDRALGQIKPS